MSSDRSDIRQNKTIQNVWWYMSIALAELVGTGMLVFLGCSSAVPGLTATPPAHIQIAISFGFAVTIIIQTFGHVSGAHLNPAVSIAACIFQLISVPMAALYAAAQIIGGILGYAAILVTTPSEYLYHPHADMNVTHGLCVTIPNPQISTSQALIVEYFATSVLIFLCCGVWDRRNALKADSAPIKFGLGIAGIAMALGTYSGASMNPARSFGPALLTGLWTAHWIYWLGPLSAGIIVTFFYKFIFDRDQPAPEIDHSDEPLNQSNSKVRSSDKSSNEALTSV